MTLDELIATANTAYDAGAGECIIAQIWAMMHSPAPAS